MPFSDVRQRRLRFFRPAERIQSVCGLVQAGRGRAFLIFTARFESLTLVAKWETIRVAGIFRTATEQRGARAYCRKAGECIAAPSAPKKEGFDFVCWRKEDGEEFFV